MRRAGEQLCLGKWRRARDCGRTISGHASIRCEALTAQVLSDAYSFLQQAKRPAGATRAWGAS